MEKSKTRCWIFIDNSNMFIQGKKFFAKYQKLKVKLDHRIRIDIGRLLDHLVRDRTMEVGKLFGSEPHPLDTVWSAIREEKIEVKVFARNEQGKEEELDNAITVSVVEESINNKDKANDGVFIIISGDRDFRPCIKKLLTNGWHVEVYSWWASLSTEIKQLKENHANKNLISLHYLDKTIFGLNGGPSCYFFRYNWEHARYRIPRDQTIVLHFKNILDNNNCKKLAEKFTENLKYPCMYTLCLNDKKYIVIIVTKLKSEHLYDMRNWDNMLGVISGWGFGDCKIISTIENYERCGSSCCKNILEDKNIENEAEPHDWNLVSARVGDLPNNISSSQCPYNFRCKNFENCGRMHDDNERRFFQRHQNGNPGYKCKPCFWMMKATGCKYKNDKLLCSYAHSVEEAWCYVCDTVGKHWMSECPEKSQFES